MNILQLTAHFAPNVGGVETHLSDLVAGLAERNFSVTVLTYQPLTTKAQWKMVEKHPKIYIFRIPWIAGLFYMFVKSPFLEFTYLFPGLFLLTPYMVIAKKIEVIHAHGLVAGSVGVFWGKILKKRVVVSTHSIYHFPKSGIYTSFVRWMFASCDHILCLSNQSKKEIEKLGIKDSKVSVFTYWIDQSIFKKVHNAKQKLKWENSFIVLFVGRLIEEKGVKVLVEAARKFDERVTCVIAGVGPLEEYVKNASRENKRIQFAGKLEQKSLPVYLSASDVLIIPSTHEEGFGRVILEALSCELPVIAANRGGIREALSEDVGYLIDITPDTICNTVAYILNQKKELKQKSQKALAYAEVHFSEKNIDAIIKSYLSD